ncbi:MAG: hypothetical protein WBF73_26760 [Bradyrhizobium sp.]
MTDWHAIARATEARWAAKAQRLAIRAEERPKFHRFMTRLKYCFEMAVFVAVVGGIGAVFVAADAEQLLLGLIVGFMLARATMPKTGD